VVKKEMKVCERCKGTGEIRVSDESYLNGYHLERCGCKYSNEDMNIPKLFQEKTLDNFKSNSGVISTLKEYVKSFSLESVKRGFYFTGSVGVGKTHLAIALLKELACKKGIRGQYISSSDLLNLKRESIRDESLFESIGRFERAELLALDDIGVEKTSTWVEEQTTSLIDQRYRNALSTIITSNYLLENLKDKFSDPAVGFRVVSRITEMCIVVYLEASDYRLKSRVEKRYAGK